MLLKDEDYQSGEVILCVIYHFQKPVDAIRKFEARFPFVRFIWHTVNDRSGVDYEGAIPDEDWAAATIYLTFGYSPRSLSLMPNLKFVQLLTAGHDHVRRTPLFSDPSIPIGTSSGVSARTIAQYAVLHILSFAHQLPATAKIQQSRRWVGAPEWPFPRVLAGRRVGMLGYGAIARQAARILHAMGMTIIACTGEPRPTSESRRHAGFVLPGSEGQGDPDGTLPATWHTSGTRESLHRFLADDLDVLVIFAPLTDRTRRIIGRDELDILGRRCPLLVNPSRGQIVDQGEMVAALKDGRLFGAALDTADTEPLDEGDELWGLPNVVLTPHMSWAYDRYIEDGLEVLAENLERFESGRRLVNEISGR